MEDGSMGSKVRQVLVLRFSGSTVSSTGFASPVGCELKNL